MIDGAHSTAEFVDVFVAEMKITGPVVVRTTKLTVTFEKWTTGGGWLGLPDTDRMFEVMRANLIRRSE